MQMDELDVDCEMYRFTLFSLHWIKISEIKCHSLQPMVVPNTAMHHVSISASSTQVVSEVLSKMLMVGITDPGT